MCGIQIKSEIKCTYSMKLFLLWIYQKLNTHKQSNKQTYIFVVLLLDMFKKHSQDCEH